MQGGRKRFHGTQVPGSRPSLTDHRHRTNRRHWNHVLRSPMHILVIDDDASLRDIVSRQLTRAGHTVTEATEGGQALLLLSAEAFDVILTDLDMPNLDGFELLRHLRQAGNAPRIVVMSGIGLAGPAQHLEIARQLGAKAVLHKPFTAPELLAAISEGGDQGSDPP